MSEESDADKTSPRMNPGWLFIGIPIFYLISFMLAVIVVSWLEYAGFNSPRLEAALTMIFFPFIWLIEQYQLADFLRELFSFLLP